MYIVYIYIHTYVTIFLYKIFLKTHKPGNQVHPSVSGLESLQSLHLGNRWMPWKNHWEILE